MAWYNATWKYRLPVTVDNTGNATSALSYYPYGVKIGGSAYTSLVANARANLADLRVTDSDGATPLDFALEGNDAAAGAVYLLVKVSCPAAASKVVYVYYGNAAGTSVSNYTKAATFRTALVGPTDILTQATVAGYGQNPITIRLRNQDQAGGGGAALNGRVLVFCTAGGSINGGTNGQIWAMTSTDAGVSFTPTLLAMPTSGNAFAMRSVGEVADGSLIMIYGYGTNTNQQAGKVAFYGARSVDGGTTWSNLSTSPASSVTVPWTSGTDPAAPYGRLWVDAASGDSYFGSYGLITGDTGRHIWLHRCPAASDPTVGTNWQTLSNPVMYDNVIKYGEVAFGQVGPGSYFAVGRNDTSGSDGDLYLSRFTTSGNTLTVTQSPARMNVPNTAAIFAQACSPDILRLASGNWLLAWGVRYGANFGIGMWLSTDGSSTWDDRRVSMPYAIASAGQNLTDYGYASADQNADGTVVMTGYRQITSGVACNVFRVIFDEDWAANASNVYHNCEASSGWVLGTQGTISATRAHNGTNSLKLDNSAGTGATALLTSAWGPTDPSRPGGKVAVTVWAWGTNATSTANFNVRIHPVAATSGPSRANAAVNFTDAHVKWYNGVSYQDTGAVASYSAWHRITQNSDVRPASVAGTIAVDDAIATTAQTQWASGTGPNSLFLLAGSTGSTNAVTYWVDDVYVHQYTPVVPAHSVGVEEIPAGMAGTLAAGVFAGSAATAAVPGSMAGTLAAGALAGAGTAIAPAAMARTLAPSAFAGVTPGASTVASMAATLGPDALAGHGSLVVTAALARTLGPDAAAGQAGAIAANAIVAAATLGPAALEGSAASVGANAATLEVALEFAAFAGQAGPPVTRSFRQALRAHLLSLESVVSLVGDNVYPGVLPEFYDLGSLPWGDGPAITYAVEKDSHMGGGAGADHHLRGSDGTEIVRVQLSAWSYTFADVEAVSDALYAALDGVWNVVWGDGLRVNSCIHQQAIDLPQAATEEHSTIYRIANEYHVRYRTDAAVRL